MRCCNYGRGSLVPGIVLYQRRFRGVMVVGADKEIVADGKGAILADHVGGNEAGGGGVIEVS